MAKRIGGNRRKTRHIYKKGVRTKGKISIREYLKQLQVGDKVILKAEPAIQGSMYFRRFHAKNGVVVGSQGNCYKVEIKDHGAAKTIITHPVHLKRI